MMEQKMDRKPSDEEIVQYIMDAEELPLTEELIVTLIEGVFQESDKCSMKGLDRITDIHWKNSQFLGGWRLFFYGEKRKGIRTVSYENEDEMKLMLMLEMLSKANQDILKETLEKEIWADKGYKVTIKETFKGISR